ncbi:MAG TPA: hypothetical protein VGG19_04900 [Tepidisphaeraceae bacterium]|jgi:tetratricopeptide (TPR) repeat protein
MESITPNLEESRLNEAMKKADDLLVSSLRLDERRRQRFRRIGWIILGFVVLFVLLPLSCLAVFMLLEGHSLRPAAETSLQRDQIALNAIDLTQKGETLLKYRQYEQAADLFKRSADINPHLASAWRGLGQSQQGLNNLNAAQAAFEIAVKLESGQQIQFDYYSLGQIYFAKSEFDKAEAALKAAGNVYGVPSLLTKIYLLESRWSEAERYAEISTVGPFISSQSDIDALLDAARKQRLPNDLRQQIAPPSYMASHVKSAPEINQLAAEGGGVPVQFALGAKEFSPGDSVVITDIHGTASTITPGNIYCIKGTYTLTSHDSATLAASTTSKYRFQGIGSWIEKQSINIVKGTGSFTLYLPLSIEGSPHISMYGEGGSFGGVYFGTGDTLLKSWGSHKPVDTIGH